MADDKPIIVIKKKGGHGGHHGGAWKIAYADFVTAMMAFFMIMWLLSAAESNVRKAVSSYFRRPGIFDAGSGTPLLIGAAGILEDGVPPAQWKGQVDPEGKTFEPPKRKKEMAKGEIAELIDLKIQELKEILKKLNKSGDADATELLEKLEGVQEQKNALENVAKEVKKQIAGIPELEKIIGTVDVKVDADGLNIEVMDTQKSSMFASGSATISPEAQAAFVKITEILKKAPNSLEIVGHTDAKPFKSRTGAYSNWELSVDRANAARKLVEAQGFDSKRITSVVGRADTELRNKENPEDASNRRITFKIKFDITQKPEKLEDLDLLKDLDKSQIKGFDNVEKTLKDQQNQLKASSDPVHSVTVEEIISEAEKKKVQLREKQREEDKVTTIQEEKDKIFKDNPIVGPSEFFQ